MRWLRYPAAVILASFATVALAAPVQLPRPISSTDRFPVVNTGTTNAYTATPDQIKTYVNTGTATSAQGAKADTAVQPPSVSSTLMGWASGAWTGIRAALDSVYHGMTVTWSEITGKPTFATVATSGSYADLTSKPTLPATKTCTGTDKLSAYDASTGTYTCTADQTSGIGSGITSLNGATVGTQTFANGANISVTTDTGTGVHTVAVADSPTFAQVNNSAADGEHMINASNSSAPTYASPAKGDYTYNRSTNLPIWYTGSLWSSVFEPQLGTPASNGYCLQSTTGNVRSWGPCGSGSGTVTSVAVSSPLTGGTITTTGTIGIQQATTSQAGYLSSTDWNTFNGKAPLASPAFTGTPTAPTATAGTNNTQIATTAFVTNAISFAGGGTIGGSTGSTDNAVLVASGTAGSTLKSTGVTIDPTTGAIAVPQSVTGTDSLGLRAQASYGTNAVSITVENAAITPYSVILPANKPADGCVNITNGLIGSAACATGTVTSVTASNSLSSTGGTTPAISLSGDSASPGNNKLYGTNGSGVKGWYAQPAGSDLTAPGPIGGTTPSTGAFTTLSTTSDNPWITQTDNGAATSSSNPAWRVTPLHSDGTWHLQSSSDGSTFTNRLNVDSAGQVSAAGGISSSKTITAKIFQATLPSANTDAATITFDLSVGDSPSVVLGGNRTLAFSNVSPGSWYRLNLIQDATGSRTVTWPSTGLVCTWRNTTGNAAPTLLTGANKVDSFVIHVLSSTSAECWTANNQ